MQVIYSRQTQEFDESLRLEGENKIMSSAK